MNNNSENSLTPDLAWETFHQEAEQLRQKLDVPSSDAIGELQAQLFEEQIHKQERYEAEVRLLVQQTYPLASQDEAALEKIRQELGLGVKTAQRIMEEILGSHAQKLQEYRIHLSKTIKTQYPFNEEQQAFLERRQRFLNLSPHVAQSLEQEVLATFATPSLDTANAQTILGQSSSSQLFSDQPFSGQPSATPHSISVSAVPLELEINHPSDPWYSKDEPAPSPESPPAPELSTRSLVPASELMSEMGAATLHPSATSTVLPSNSRSKLVFWTIGGGLLIALLAATGIIYQRIHTYRTMRATLTQAEQSYQQRDYAGCIQSATIVSSYPPLQTSADTVLKDCQEKQRLADLDAAAAQSLQQAKALVKSYRLQEAITFLLTVSPESASYDQAQAMFKDLSSQMLKIAEGNYQMGQIQNAVAIVAAIPDTSPVYPAAKSRLSNWQQTWQRNEQSLKTAQKALDAGRLDEARIQAQLVKNSPFQQKQAKAILTKVEIELAKIVPPPPDLVSEQDAPAQSSKTCTTWPEVDPKNGEMRPVTRCN